MTPAALTWAHERGVTLRLIESGNLNQNAYIESFNGRLRDECLNEHWFTDARSIAKQLTERTSTVTAGVSGEPTATENGGTWDRRQERPCSLAAARR